MKVNELKPRMAVDEITVEIVSKGEARSFATERGAGRVCNCAAGDDSGEISLTLWNEQIDSVNEGDKVLIQNGWVGEYKGNLQLGAGKKGTLTVLKEDGK